MSDVNLIGSQAASRTTQQTTHVSAQHIAEAPEPVVPVAAAPEVRTTVKETVTVADDPQRSSLRRTRHVIWFVVNLIAILIVVRMVLLILGADPQSGFAAFWYGLTGVLTFPFQGLFGPPTEPTYGVSIFEGSSLVAIAIYYLFGWIGLRIASLSYNRRAITRTEVTDRETRVEADA